MAKAGANGNGVGHLLDHARRLGHIESTVTQHGQRLTALEKRTARRSPRKRFTVRRAVPYLYGIAILGAAAADKISWSQAGTIIGKLLH